MQNAGLLYHAISSHAPAPTPHGGAVVTVRPCGLSLKAHSQPTAHREGDTPTRGEIRGLSKRSRKRLLRVLAGIDWQQIPCYLATLTYADTWGGCEQWHADLKAFLQRLERRYGVGGVLWRLEFQQRGAPHFHCLLFFSGALPDLRAFRQWVSRAWYEIAGHGNAKHLRAGTNVRPVHTRNGVGRLLSYLSKYVGKASKALIDESTGELLPTGRQWGAWGRLPEGESVAYTLTERAYVELTRRIRAWAKSTGGRYGRKITAQWRGFLLLGEAGRLAQLLRGLEGVSA